MALLWTKSSHSSLKAMHEGTTWQAGAATSTLNSGPQQLGPALHIYWSVTICLTPALEISLGWRSGCQGQLSLVYRIDIIGRVQG